MTERNPEIGRSITTDGITTNYHDVGEGPPVLLIHGSGPGVSAFANWRLTFRDLATSFRLLAPDMLGFGYTDRAADGVYTSERWLDQLVGFLDAMDVDRVHVIGNSFGGSMALALAIGHPETCRPDGVDGQRGRAVRAHARPRRCVGLRAVVREHAGDHADLRLRPVPDR
jgi:2-hydroxymuconate-semialdehyde hydrolase